MGVSQDERPRARETMLLAAIVVVGVGLRFTFLNARSWWVDECSTVLVTRLAPEALVAHVLHREDSPPLYFLLIVLWSRIAGSTEAGLRSLSALLGTATIGVAYGAARLVSVRAGLVAAALAAVNPMLVWFSLEARMYALLILLGGVSFWFFARALERPSRWNLGTWAAASALALWTHYFSLALVAPEALWLLMRLPRSRAVWASLVAIALAGAALVPFALWDAGSFTAWMTLRSWRLRAASIIPEFLLGPQPPAPLILAPIGLVAPAVALWLLARRADAVEQRGAARAALIGGTALLLPVLASLLTRFDVLTPRYLLTGAVPLLVVVAVGLGAGRAGWLGILTLVLSCVLGVAIDLGTAYDSKFEHEDWRGAAHAVGPASGPRLLVVTPPRGGLPLSLYRPRLRPLERERAVVSEIVVVGLPPVMRVLGEPSLPPRPPSPSPPSQFRLVERLDADSFTLARYRAEAPVHVDPSSVTAMALVPGASSLMLELPDDAAPGSAR
jgi:hypothetical protein